MSEIRRIHAGINPASYPICNSESDVRTFSYAADEKGILTAIRPSAFVFSTCADMVVGVEVEDVCIGIVTAVFGCEGCSNAICELGIRR
jgi:hypothetical protein